jgi:Fe2+ transport system protein B
MRNKILTLLLCISVGAVAVPSFAAETEKTASPAVTVEAGKTSGSEKGTGQVTSSGAAAVDMGELPDSEAAVTTSETPHEESDLEKLILAEAEKVEDVLDNVEVDKVEDIIRQIDDVVVDLLEKMENVDKEELMKNLIAVQTLLQSEEIRTIMNYQEMKELIQEVIATEIDFAKSDPELCIEVLDKLGLPRVLGTVVMEGIAVSSLTGDMVRSLSVEELFSQMDMFNSVVGKVIEENDVLKAVSSLELDGGTE